MFEFMDFDYLTDGEIDLRINTKLPADDAKGYLPAYQYKIMIT
jgi:tagatose 1,6-diphosphate aldolase